MANKMRDLLLLKGARTDNPEAVSQVDELVRLVLALIQVLYVTERRQTINSIVLTVASLILGWLLSLISTPETLFATLIRLLHP